MLSIQHLAKMQPCLLQWFNSFLSIIIFCVVVFPCLGCFSLPIPKNVHSCLCFMACSAPTRVRVCTPGRWRGSFSYTKQLNSGSSGMSRRPWFSFPLQ